jgi:arylamine N-acetyltransferase
MRIQRDRFFDRYRLTYQSADLHFLKSLAEAFSHLPYENVTKILKGAGNSVSEEKFRRTPEVLEDHLRWNTGGTCFSLCNALQQILESCGYRSFIAMADMHYGANIHCAVIVETGEERYLLDPGYLLHHPIPLPKVQISQDTPMNTVILTNEGNEKYSLFTEEYGIQRWRYRLRAKPVSHKEFEKHWLHSFSLNGMEHILLTRLHESGRIYYRKDRLELIGPQGRTSQKIFPGECEVLSSMFGLPSDLILAAQKALNR